jgi:hypothetical protein
MKKICNTKAWKTVEKVWQHILKDVPLEKCIDEFGNELQFKVMVIKKEHIVAAKKLVRWNLRKHVTAGTYCIRDDVYYRRFPDSFTKRDLREQRRLLKRRILIALADGIGA